jgi:hypothetical protein
VIRDVEKKDYETLCGWWKCQNFEAPPWEILPATGYIANETAAAWLYLSNSPIAWIEWVVVDPKAPKKLRGNSIDAVIEHVAASAKFTGATVLFTSTSNFPFMERLRRHGFAEGDKRVNQFVRTL